MEPFLKRTWAQVDLDALDHNIREIRSAIAPSAKLMCVIKADGYGHGAVPLAKESEAAGADWFAVSNLEEAQELREAGIQKPILILGFTPDSDARLLAQMEISQAVLSESHARQLSSYAQEAGTRVRVHIAVDTGMTRIGLSAQNQTQALEAGGSRSCLGFCWRACSPISLWRTRRRPGRTIPKGSIKASGWWRTP